MYTHSPEHFLTMNGISIYVFFWREDFSLKSVLIATLKFANVVSDFRYLKKVIEDSTASEDTLKLLRVSRKTICCFKEALCMSISTFNGRYPRP